MLDFLLSGKAQTGVFTPPAGVSTIAQNSPVAGDYFGYSVDVSSDSTTVVVGAYGVNGTAGAAYVFSVSGGAWVQQAKLTAADGAAGDYLGVTVSVSADGNTVLATAYNKSSGRGAVYVYNRVGTTWTQEAKLVGTQNLAGEQFGFSASLSQDGKTIAVGADTNNESGYGTSGATYVFVKNGVTWSLQSKVFSQSPAASELFGYSVSLSGDGNTLAVAAIGYASSRGAVYIYNRSGTTWTYKQVIWAADGLSNEWFGNCVSISRDGQNIVTGAHLKNSAAGAAYVFKFNGVSWAQQAKLVAPDSTSNFYFGYSTSISDDGNVVNIGSHATKYPNGASWYTMCGAAYIFTRTNGTTWSTGEKKSKTVKVNNDKFGYSTAVDGPGVMFAVSVIGQLSNKGGVFIYA